MEWSCLCVRRRWSSAPATQALEDLPLWLRREGARTHPLRAASSCPLPLTSIPASWHSQPATNCVYRNASASQALCHRPRRGLASPWNGPSDLTCPSLGSTNQAYGVPEVKAGLPIAALLSGTAAQFMQRRNVCGVRDGALNRAQLAV